MFNTTNHNIYLALVVGYQHPPNWAKHISPWVTLGHLGCCLMVTVSFTSINSDLLQSSLVITLFFYLYSQHVY